MSSLTIEALPYTADLLSHYETLSALPGFILLDSSDTSRGRYDILTAYPYDTLTLSSPSADVFDDLERRLPKIDSVSDLPFQGGIMGYFSYDFGAERFGISTKTLPYKPMPLLHLGYYDWAIVADHRRRCVHLVAAHQRSETETVLNEVRSRWHRPRLLENVSVCGTPFSPLITKDEYRDAFVAIHEAVMAGRAYQVNYTQPFLGEYDGDTWGIYRRIRRVNPVPYSAFLRTATGDILSFSPEHFLSWDKGRVMTSPIKGTMKRSSSAKEDALWREQLLQSSKNRAENVMIVDLLRNDLGQFAKPGSVQVPLLCDLQSFNAVHHLVSCVTADARDGVTMFEAFAACFPGGSITGAPKREAMRIIHEQERFARGVYCGSIVYFSSHGRFDSNIAIRTLVAEQGIMSVSAGGALVVDSNWEDEYHECFLKIEAIKRALQV